MKALSILQPWAWLIVQGYKDVENRTWWTGYRGPVLIHAGKTYTRGTHDDAVIWLRQQYGIQLPMYDSIPRGGIVGRASVIACVRESESPWFNGPYGFVLKDREPLPFAPLRGMLGFFDVPGSAFLSQVLSQEPKS